MKTPKYKYDPGLLEAVRTVYRNYSLDGKKAGSDIYTTTFPGCPHRAEIATRQYRDVMQVWTLANGPHKAPPFTLAHVQCYWTKVRKEGPVSLQRFEIENRELAAATTE